MDIQKGKGSKLPKMTKNTRHSYSSIWELPTTKIMQGLGKQRK